MQRLTIPTEDGLWLSGQNLLTNSDNAVTLGTRLDDPILVQDGVWSWPYSVSTITGDQQASIIYRFIMDDQIITVSLTTRSTVTRKVRAAGFVSAVKDEAKLSIDRSQFKPTSAVISIAHSPDAARLIKLERLRQKALSLIAQARKQL